MSLQNVTFPSNGGQAHGYLQLPGTGSGPGVIVIQEWWGLTSHIADLTRRLAAEGFVALAPDLYGGTTTHDAAEAQQLMKDLPAERAAKDLGGAVDYLLGLDAVTSAQAGVIGFCMGGGFVLSLAAERPGQVSAAVPFYGFPGDPAAVAGKVRAAVQGHYATKDHIPVDAVRELFQSFPTPGELHVYEAGHAFLNDENLLGTYDPEAAALAWSRAVAFLHEHVGR